MADDRPSLLQWLFGQAGPEPLPPFGPPDEFIRNEALAPWLERMNDRKGRSDPGIFAGLREPAQTGDPVEGLPPPDMWHRPRSDMPSIQLFNKFYNEPQEDRITEVSLQEPRMQTLAQILAGIPADPTQVSQGIAPLLQQHMMAAQSPGMQQPGMEPSPGMPPEMQPQAGSGGLPPQLLRLLLQQQQQQPGLGSMGDGIPPMTGAY